MNKVLSFVRLDFITVKPYFTLKNLALMIAAPLFILIADGGSNMSVSFFMIFAVMYINYPFVISEKSGMDALYPTLSITRGTVVIGRYLFAFVFNLCAALTGLLLTGITLFITKNTVNILEVLPTTVIVLIAVTLIEAIQLPIYFKLGYEKAKMLAYLPFIGLMLLGLVGNRLIPKGGGLPKEITGFLGWVDANTAIAVIIAAVIWLGLMVISCQASMEYYRKRDF